jgi:hypothetical protein
MGENREPPDNLCNVLFRQAHKSVHNGFGNGRRGVLGKVGTCGGELYGDDPAVRGAAHAPHKAFLLQPVYYARDRGGLDHYFRGDARRRKGAFFVQHGEAGKLGHADPVGSVQGLGVNLACLYEPADKAAYGSGLLGNAVLGHKDLAMTSFCLTN